MVLITGFATSPLRDLEGSVSSRLTTKSVHDELYAKACKAHQASQIQVISHVSSPNLAHSLIRRLT